jgi:pilus assembly protein TadC
MFVMRRQKDIEKNLLAALEDINVQLNSGIPLFSVLVNISSSDYGELSVEFKGAVQKINAGSPEQEVLEELSKRNPSIFFKRTLWQISNGMNAGSDMAIVVKDSMRALNEEQMIQIQNYGNKLNPLMVFYMLAAVIIPALSVTFLTIFSSMVNLPKSTTQMMFIGLFIMVMFIQFMFMGLIKSRRPSLL